MKLSVIIPVYRVEKTLERCVASVAEQSYRDLEIILIDDGSPDNCPKLCDEWALRDKRIKVIHKTNGGLSDARNTGIEVAVGKYITFIDSDDYITVNTLKGVMGEMKEEFDMLEYPIFRFFGSEKQSILKFPDRTYNNMEEYWLKSKAYTHTYACNKIFRRSLFEKVRFPKGKLFEDVYTLPEILKKAKIVGTTSKGLYLYCWNKNSITATADGKALETLLDAHIGSGNGISDEEYYMHVLNIQLDVTDRTGIPPKLNGLRIKKIKGLGISATIKAIALNILGIKHLCRIHRILYQIKKSHW